MAAKNRVNLSDEDQLKLARSLLYKKVIRRSYSQKVDGGRKCLHGDERIYWLFVVKEEGQNDIQWAVFLDTEEVIPKARL